MSRVRILPPVRWVLSDSLVSRRSSGIIAGPVFEGIQACRCRRRRSVVPPDHPLQVLAQMTLTSAQRCWQVGIDHPVHPIALCELLRACNYLFRLYLTIVSMPSAWKKVDEYVLVPLCSIETDN